MNSMDSSAQATQEAPSQSRTPVRSREGCSTCKRRKVKCDENRPRCSHCERLDLECIWQPPSRHKSRRRRRRQKSTDEDTSSKPNTPVVAVDTSVDPAALQPPHHSVQEVFDYASFMWDSTDCWQQVTPEINTDDYLNLDGRIGQVESNTFQLHLRPKSVDPQPPRSIMPSQPGIPISTGLFGNSDISNIPLNSNSLLEYFAQSDKPPIVAEVETDSKWIGMRQAVVRMAQTSCIVRSAIMAFSSVLISRRGDAVIQESDQEDHYGEALKEASRYDSCDLSLLTVHTEEREHLLTGLFFLSYVEILENRIDAANAHLKQAYGIFHNGDKVTFVFVEKQVLRWMQLLDSKTVSSGGEGLFLSKNDQLVLVDSPGSSFNAETIVSSSANPDIDDDIEDALLQPLAQPGICFFQKVQAFKCRIAKIDPWHRPRGTVEDEIEVMNLGVKIASDLRNLYDQRPPLMDYAVAGRLGTHISPELARAITRSFRTYLSNYYANKIHLHRVAYKSLPLTEQASDALTQIRYLAKNTVEDNPEEPLSVNMLWPLLMLGAEEKDLGERAWILGQILRMESVATNARITARVLEEVQSRQDATKLRIDIRSVMHDVFQSSFAVV